MIKAAMLTVAAALYAAAATSSTPVTFHKDVLPILQNRCQECHREGEIGPFALMDYKQTRPLAKSIKEAVLTRKMPPWFADAKVGHFSNDDSLSKQEIDTIVAWVDGGAKEGDPKDAPKPREFTSGWQIGKPDVVFRCPSPSTSPPRASSNTLM